MVVFSSSHFQLHRCKCRVERVGFTPGCGFAELDKGERGARKSSQLTWTECSPFGFFSPTNC